MIVSVSQDELRVHGYTEITHQNDNGEVILRDASGHLEVFQISSHHRPSWSIPTEDGRCLEFVRAITWRDGLSTHCWED